MFPSFNHPFFEVRICGLIEFHQPIRNRLKFRFHPGDLEQVLFIRNLNNGFLIPAPRLHSGVRSLIEKREETIVILLGNGVIFMVMALGTLHAQSKPDHGGGLHAIYRVLHPKFFRDRSTFVGRRIVSEKSGGDLLTPRRFWK